VLFPAVGRANSPAPLIEQVPELSSARPVVTVDMKVPSLTFYLDRVVEVLEMDELQARLEQEDAAVYVFAEVDMPEVPPAALERLRELGRHGKFIVFEEGGPPPAER
jgi:hypothetical protein